MTNLLDYPDPKGIESTLFHFDRQHEHILESLKNLPDGKTKDLVNHASGKFSEAIAFWRSALAAIESEYQIECDRLKAEIMVEAGGKEWLERAGIRKAAFYRARRPK